MNDSTDAVPDPPLCRDPLIGTLLADCYRVTRVIGQGGMGRVYAGDDEGLGRRVAIKVILPGADEEERALKRFEREAKAVAALKHPNVVDVYYFGQMGDGTRYLVMEYLQGESLQARLDRDGPLPLDATVAILAQTADALGAAHGKGIIHRDLKPENLLLLRREGRSDFVKVLDFGLAKPVQREADNAPSAITQAGMAIGTSHYMSPEQILWEPKGKPIDHRSDVYSLAMVAYAMVCGRPAFVGPSQVVIIHQATEPPPPPRPIRPDLPVEAESALLRALAKQPSQRFESAGAFAEAFIAGVRAAGRTPAHAGRASAPAGDAEPAVAPPVPSAGPLTRAVDGLDVAAPSTLTAASGEAQRARVEETRRSRLRPALVAGGIVLAVAAGIGWWLVGQPARDSGAVAGPSEPLAAPTARGHAVDPGGAPGAGAGTVAAGGVAEEPDAGQADARVSPGAPASVSQKKRASDNRSRAKRPRRKKFDLDL